MSQNNLLPGYNWDSQQFEDTQLSRPLQDEVISVYEVYVKEEENSDARSDGGSAISGSTSGRNSTSTTNQHQLIQRAIFNGDCMDLDAAIDAEIMNDGDVDDGATVTKLLGKESLKYKIVEQSNDTVCLNQTVSEQQGDNATIGPRLIDKDDPRSRLHFVKYLKRDGKTLKIWECGICTKEFRHQYTLMRHLPTHTDERNFKCDACGKAFRQLSTLSQHKAIHSDARPYVCEFCKKTFNRVSTLISHRKTHSELKPHKCHVCGKGFHQKGNLRNHVFTHTNERPYKCELCAKGFNQMSNLVCHKIKAHAHSEKMQYSCGLCGKEFPRRFALRSHEEYKHGIKYRNPSGISREPKQQQPSANSTATSTSTGATATANTTPSSTPPTTGSNVMRNKNVRIVDMPSDECNEGSDGDQISQAEYSDSVVIDRIETKALENAIIEGQTPFALLKPVKGIPVLVKVSPAGLHNHLLTPATAEDLRMMGKMSPTLTADRDGLKGLQIKVPVVATIKQSVDETGKQSFTVEAPGSDQEEESLVAPLDSHFPFQDTNSSLRLHSANSLFHAENDDLKIEANPTTNSQSEDCSELLELAAQGGIQFVRATEDGRYEVMTNSEARELMAQNSHDVTILDGEDADALDIVNSRGGENPGAASAASTSAVTLAGPQEDFMIDDPDGEIMVLDSLTNTQKSIGLEGIEIFDDKDIKILDPKNLDDRVIDGMTFLSQMKIDDLILVPGKSTDDTSIVSSPTAHHDFTAISALANQTINMSSILGKQPQNLSIISADTMNYLRHCTGRGLPDELIIPDDEPPDIDLRYNGLMKFNDLPDGASMDAEQTSNLMAIGHPRSHQNTSRLMDYYRGNEARSYWDSQRNMQSFGQVKILGGKNCQESLDGGSIQLQDVRILGNYEQYINSAGFGQQIMKSKHHEENMQAARKEIKILGKTLECGFFENTEDGKLLKIEEEACRKMVNDAWEGWIETNRCSFGERADYDENGEDDEDKENDITYAGIIDTQI